MNVKLVVVQGKPEGKEIPLRIPKFLVGRGTECHLRPNSELVSRHHCLIILDENQVRLRDLGSTNGTLVNGERITNEIVVQSGDVIQVGPLGFEIVLEPVLEPVPVALPPAAVAAARRPAPSAAHAASAKLGSKTPRDTEFDQWLEPDTQHESHDRPIAKHGAESATQNTALDVINGQDTKSEIETPPLSGLPRAEPAQEGVDLERVAAIKSDAPK